MNKTQKLAFTTAIAFTAMLAFNCSSDSNNSNGSGDETSSSSITATTTSSSSEQSSSSAQQSSSSDNGGGSSSSIAESEASIAGLQESLYKNVQVVHWESGENFTGNADVFKELNNGDWNTKISGENGYECYKYDDDDNGVKVDCGEDYNFNAGKIVNGKLTLNLPTNIPNKFLKATDDPDLFTLYIDEFGPILYDGKYCFLQFQSGIKGENVNFTYVSKSLFYDAYDVSLSKGWNILFLRIDEEHNIEVSSSYNGEGTLAWRISGCE